MDDSAALTSLARVSGLLVSRQDPLDVVTAGLDEACHQVAADAGGVLVAGEASLDLLAATSHRAADLEFYQAGGEDGPCVECMRINQPVAVDSPAEADARFPGFGEQMHAAGYVRAYAVPMVWQGTSVGGLNLFWQAGGSLDDADRTTLQALADILTIAVVHVRPVAVSEALERLQDALSSRADIEQAKGVLAWQRDLDMETAYTALVGLAAERGLGLQEAARQVVQDGQHGTAW